ncbi:LLM class flavin-dependent oxidoreductase [Streptomyces cellulosae]|uniref:LLM class flavin-dependent oxidoreductase n=2 Tax=Streptomyces TaxID=1883 RepID=UPI00225279A0|nr:LLM class flavin-dependent oxidoreductase [Streptomyces cellulosae]
MKLRRTMHLNVFLSQSGHHSAAWRHPRADPRNAACLQHYVALAKSAEAAAMDSVFIADGLSIGAEAQYEERRNFEPLTLLAALAVSTFRIGLIATASTSFSEPYNLARSFASLDHISKGRAGWNIVTTAEERSAQNFGGWPADGHDARYARADEFVRVAKQLWDSWGPTALCMDTATGTYTDLGNVREINHVGQHFRVRGPLNIPPCPQTYPLLVQAGSSPRGMAFAAEHAEVVFSVHQRLEAAARFCRSLRQTAAAYGRDVEMLRVLPGLVPVVADSEKAAGQLKRELDDLVPTEKVVAFLEERLGIDLAGADLDAPLPVLPPPSAFAGQQGRYQVIKDLAERNLTIRQVFARLSAGRGHATVVGTPDQIADHMQEWFEGGAADGFTVLPPLLPDGLDDFIAGVVPVLRRRRLLRREYEGDTIRDHYRLPSPRAGR